MRTCEPVCMCFCVIASLARSIIKATAEQEESASDILERKKESACILFVCFGDRKLNLFGKKGLIQKKKLQ